MATKSSKEAATPRTPRTAEAQTPRPAPRFDEGFAGAPPEQEGWFATNHLCLKGGVLHQLHKSKAEDGGPAYWWFPVKEAE